MRKILLRTGEKFHKINNRYTVLLGFSLAAFLCVGCGKIEARLPENTDPYNTKATSMESTPVVDYVIPVQLPNILVDESGYLTGGVKRAAVKGEKLPEQFQLINADTGEVVYSSTLENFGFNEDLKQYSAYADFREFKESGDFYLECEYIGQSLTFSLMDAYYETFFAETCEAVSKDISAGNVSYQDLLQVLQAYEWYGDVFPDLDGDKIPDLLKVVATHIETQKKKEIVKGQEAEFVACLAKFSFLYQKYDYAYANECMRRAVTVFDQNQAQMQRDASCFHALTELYRSTGRNTYKNQIEEYKTYFDAHLNLSAKEGYLFGAMTYLNTRQPVDVGLCKKFMDACMGQGEEISGSYGEMLHPLTPHNDGEEDLLEHASELACANYIMNNYQYNRILEEFMHYLRGRNGQSIDYYEGTVTKRTTYLLLLSQLVAVRDQMEATIE